MKILLAGCGDLGQRTAQQLQALGHSVLALSRHRPSLIGLDWFGADLTQPDSLLNLQSQSIQQICYCVAPQQRSSDSYRQLYYQGLQNLMQQLPGIPLVFVSSTSVYGDLTGDVDEHSPLPNIEGPAFWLQQAEQQVLAAQGSVLRLAGIYGPGRYQLLQQIRQGGTYPEHSGYGNRIHIEDAARLLAALCLKPKPRPVYLGVDQDPAPMSQVERHLRAQFETMGIECQPAQQPLKARQHRRCRSRYPDELPPLRYPSYVEGYQALLAGYQDWLKQG